jgi:energy-coupling factor transporter ATP-binding protein EcfA2
VGANGSGKSTILAALNVFFRNQNAPTDTTTLQVEDFYLKRTSDPIVITVTFCDLSEDAMEDFRDYVRHDRLTVKAKAKWDDEQKRANVQQYGSRLVMPQFAPYFHADSSGKKAAELRSIYESLRDSYPDLPKVTTKGDMAAALREYEAANPSLCELMDSEDQFYGWSKGANRLAKHCQWVYIPAVKDSSEEQQEGRATALGQLLQHSIRTKVNFSPAIQTLREELEEKYQQMLERQQSVLAELAMSLQRRLREWSHPGALLDLQWHYDEDKGVVVNEPLARARVGEGAFVGELARLGHGLQRSFLVSLLQELATNSSDDQPTLILGFEEPEIYQHPPQARHLATVLEQLAGKDAQVLVTTHSPYFVSGRGVESVVLTRKMLQEGETTVHRVSYEEVSQRLALALGSNPAPPTVIMAAVEQIMQPSQNEIYFSTVPILVEGIEDVAFISTYLKLMDLWPEFRRYGCHFIVCGGKGPMSRPLAIALELSLPPFVIFDGDSDDTGQRKKHENDNGCLLALAGYTSASPNPEETYWAGDLVMWDTKIDDVVRTDIGPANWTVLERRVREEYSMTESVKSKNNILIAATLERAWKEGHRSESLQRLCTALIDHAARVHRTMIEELPVAMEA